MPPVLVLTYSPEAAIQLNISPSFDAFNEGDLLELSSSYLVWENENLVKVIG